MIRAAFDANVVVSGLPASRGVPAELVERWIRREFELVLSEHILDGVARAWAKPYYNARYPATNAQRALALLRARATLVEPIATVYGVADDEEDDLVLATAVAGGATHLVTGDKGLRSLGTYQGIAILSPREFLDLLEERDATP